LLKSGSVNFTLPYTARRKKYEKNSLVLKFFFGLVLFVALGTTATNYVFANNHGDTRVARYSTGDGGDTVTPPRKKEDKSSMYVYNDKSAKSFYARSAGSWGGSTYYLEQVTTIAFYVPVGQSRYITNYVKETKDATGKPKPSYSHAVLVIMPGSHSKTWLSFLWSPDSI